uniref:Aminotransferase-like plant mobile domain-containing protein n=2 Tax=Quercus lobata TaxID=97700 RepID=A0A7N2RBY1_QUELO
MTLFFKDSKIGEESALFIYKKKDGKDAKAMTLIVRPPIIGRFSEKWGRNSYPLNLPKWSQIVPSDGGSNLETTILLASHHKNVARSKPYNTLGREIIVKRADWDFSFSVNGGFSYFSLYWDWLEDVLSRCKHLLDCWSSSTNTLHTSVGEISITPWDLFVLGGLPCTGAFYDEVVPNAQELDGINDQGRPYLPYSYRYLFLAYHHLQNRLKRQGKVSVHDWITFWYRGNNKYPAPRKPARQTTIPKCSQNPLGEIKEHGPWLDKEHGVFADLQVEGDLKEETYLSALLSCWLCIFVFPIKDQNSIRPGTFKIASSIANGRSFGLASPVLASIYRGLNTISSSPTPSKSGASFAIHYVYAWVGHFFRSNRLTHDKPSDALMTKYSSVGYASPFNEFSARKHIRNATNFLWHRTAFKKNYNQTFIDNDRLSIQKFDYFMSLRSGYLSLRCEDQHIVEPYSPHRFSRRFGFHQDIPGDLKEEIHTGSLKDLCQFYQSFTRCNTDSKVLISAFATDFGSRVRHSYKQWWERVCGNDFTKGTDLLADIASFPVKLVTSNKPQRGKRELQDPYIPQPLSKFARRRLEDGNHSKDSSQHNEVTCSQGTKSPFVVPVRDAIKISEEEVCNDLGSNWRHSKSPMEGVDPENSINHAHLFANSESSISKPSAKSSDLRRCKFADVGTSSKFPIETERAPLPSLQPTKPPEVSVFQAKAHISSVRRKGASMLGDVLLNRLSNLSVDTILPQAEVHEIYSGVESFGVDPQHLRENVDKYCEGIADYLKMKESLNKRPSPVILSQRQTEVEFLLSEASQKKASLKTELDAVKLRMVDLKTELVQLEQSLSQIETHQVEQDNIVQDLEEQLEEVKFAPVLEDQDIEALEKIRVLLEDNRSSLKDLKWMS